MIRSIILGLLTLAMAACHKTHYQPCGDCSCINNDVVSYRDTTIDSAAFYQAILGTWYIKKFDTFLPVNCTTRCLCDSTYPVVFLNDTLMTATFPGNKVDTFTYAFNPGYRAHTIDAGIGHFLIPGSPYTFAYLSYYGSYMMIYTQTLNPGTVAYPPNYILSRH